MLKTLIILVLPLLITSCRQASKEEVSSSAQTEELSSSQKELEEAPDEMISSFTVSGYTKGGKKQWDLEGKSADIMTQEIKLIDVTGKVYGKETDMTIVADEGTLNRIDNSIHLEKNVRATTDDGATLTTDYLDWDAQRQLLSSDAPVWIERGMMEAQGTGIVAQPALSFVELKKDVTVKISLEEKTDDSAQKQDADDLSQDEPPPPTVITCDGPLEVQYEKNMAIFRDNVKVKDNRGEIFADKMDVYFGAQTEKSKQMEGMEGMGIEKVVAVGDVEIHHGGNITYSQRAVYDAATGKLTLTGQPKLVIYSTEAFSQLMGTQ